MPPSDSDSSLNPETCWKQLKNKPESCVHQGCNSGVLKC